MSPAVAPGEMKSWHCPTLQIPDPAVKLPEQYCWVGQSSFVRQLGADIGVHVPLHTRKLESPTQEAPGAHCTSSMQTPPLGKLPENAALHDVGTLGRFTKSMSQASPDIVAKQDAAWVALNSAVPSATATTAAVAMLKPTAANLGSPYAWQMS